MIHETVFATHFNTTTATTKMDTSSGTSSEHQQRSVPLELLRLSDFSIDHILHRAGQRCDRRHQTSPPCATDDAYFVAAQRIGLQHQQPHYVVDSGRVPMFNWLQYTRYHPPRPQKSQPKPATGPVRRTPGRLPRVPFSAAQLCALESAYRQSTYLSSEDANRLADRLDLTSTRVKIWFQNRRARERRERREQHQDGASGPPTHDSSGFDEASSSPVLSVGCGGLYTIDAGI